MSDKAMDQTMDQVKTEVEKIAPVEKIGGGEPDFLAFLDEEEARQREALEEQILLAPPAVDIVTHIASVIAKKEDAMCGKIDFSTFITQDQKYTATSLAAYYLHQSLNPQDARKVLDGQPHTLERFILAEVLHNTENSYVHDLKRGFAEKVNDIGSMLASRIGALTASAGADLRAEWAREQHRKQGEVKTNGARIKEKNQEKKKEEKKKGTALDLQYVGYHPETLIAAQVIADGCKGIEERVRSFETAAELRSALLVNAVAALIDDHQRRSKIIKNAFRSAVTLDTAACYAMFALAAEQKQAPGAVTKVDHLEEMLFSDWLVSLRTAAVKELLRDMEQLQRWSVNYLHATQWIACHVREQLQTIIELPQNVASKKEFDAWKKGLLEAVVKGWEIDRASTDVKPRDFVATVHASKGHKYSNGVSVERLPLGSVGHCGFDARFGQFERDAGELVKVFRRILPQTPGTEINIGDKVEVENDEDYACTKKGSWGYVQKSQNRSAWIDFHLVTGVANQRERAVYHVALANLKKAKEPVLPLEDAVMRGERVFVLGDEVCISDTSPYRGQSVLKGTITEMSTLEGELPYAVRFADGFENRYADTDLEFVAMPARWQRKIEEAKQPPTYEEAVQALCKKVKPVLDKIVEDTDVQLAALLSRREQFFKERIAAMERLGISRGVINFLFKTQGAKLDDIVEKGILGPGVFDELNALEPAVDLGARVRAIAGNIFEELGIVVKSPDVNSEEQYTAFKTNLFDLLLGGYRLQNGGVKTGDLAVVKTTDEKLEARAGTTGKVEGVCSENNYHFTSEGKAGFVHIAHACLQPIKAAFDIVPVTFQKGARVEVAVGGNDARWNPEYFLQRNKNFPNGTKGIIVATNYQKAGKDVVKFDGTRKYEFSQEWSTEYDARRGYGFFYEDELRIVVQEDQQERIAALRKEFQPTLDRIVTDVEAVVKGRKEQRLAIAKRTVDELLTVGYSLKAILQLVNKHVKYTRDLQEAKIL